MSTFNEDPRFFRSINGEAGKRADFNDAGARYGTGYAGSRDPQFRLVRSKEFKLSAAPNYLVHGVIPREGLILVWGPPKCGKSFWAYDLLMHVALKREYRGHRVEQGTVIYIACEGERGLAARNAAFWQKNLSETDNPPFYLLTTRLDLPGQIDQLIMDIAGQVPPGPVGSVVLDTLNRSIRGSESSDEDMSHYVAAADALRERFKCAVIIIHHCGVNDSRPRGHTSLTGAVDAQISIKRDQDGNIIALIEWMKDGPEGDQFVSRLIPVDVGIDDNGELITSCVVEPVEGAVSKPKQPKPKLPDSAKIALAQLKNVLTIEGVTPPIAGNGHMSASTIAVRYDSWRQHCYTAGIADTPAAKQKSFVRAVARLQANEIIKQWDVWVWLVH